jgi:hypothetical protein
VAQALCPLATERHSAWAIETSSSSKSGVAPKGKSGQDSPTPTARLQPTTAKSMTKTFLFCTFGQGASVGRGLGNTGSHRCVPGPQRFKYDRPSSLSFTLGARFQAPPSPLHTNILPPSPPTQPTPSQCLFCPPRRPPPTARLNVLTAG